MPYALKKVNLGKNGLSEYGESFLEYLQDKNLIGIQNLDRIIQACKVSEEHAIGKTRNNGDVAESHTYEVARFYIDLHGEKISENGIIAALLHDYIEDNSINPQEHEEIVKEIRYLLGEDVSIIVDLLSKPNFNLYDGVFDIEKKQNRNKDYFGNFKSLKILKNRVRLYFLKNDYRGFSSDDISKYAFIVACIKLSDRIHNLMTLDENVYTIEKMERKIGETEEYLIHLALEVGKTHPLILDKLRDVLIKANRRLIALKKKEVLAV